MRKDENAATAAATALLTAGEETETTDETETEAPEGASEEVTEQETVEDDFPNFEIELPEDLLEELGDTDEPTLESVTTALESEEEYLELDDEGRKLMARAVAAERKAAYYETMRLKDASKNWVDEAKKFFPLSAPFLEEITPTSRKQFLREAKARHEAVLPLVKPITEQAKKVIEQERDKARAEGKAEAEKAWGKPAGNTGQGAPVDASITQEDLARNRSKGDLTATIKSMIFGGKES